MTEKGVSASVPGVTAFARVAYSPPDRNLIDFYVDGGIGFVGLVPGRPLDRFGAGIAYMRISGADQKSRSRHPAIHRHADSGAQQRDRDRVDLRGPSSSRAWLMAPYFQYIFRPSGGIPNPNDPTGLSRIGDAAVFGVTTTLKY